MRYAAAVVAIDTLRWLKRRIVHYGPALPPTKPGAIHVKSSSSSLVEGALSGADQPPRMRAVGGVQKSFRNVGG